jgi:hypothetical protein
MVGRSRFPDADGFRRPGRPAGAARTPGRLTGAKYAFAVRCTERRAEISAALKILAAERRASEHRAAA